jgi:Holliday junction DNA helicase RuvA
LVALGINRQAAEGAIQKAMQQNADANVEELIKKALQNL